MTIDELAEVIWMAATTTTNETVSFDGTHLRVEARRGKTTKTVPLRAISSVELSEYRWSTRPVLVPKDARFELKVWYGSPVETWDGASYVPMAQGFTFHFPKDQGDAVRDLHTRLLAAL